MSETRGLPRAEPRYFGTGTGPLFGWLHQPTPGVPPKNVGIVICNPLGYEALCAYRSLRHFAEEAAELGFPALRFDYSGTGDSAGDELDGGQWDAWCASTLEAIRELKLATGVTRVCLLGFRLGGAVAAEVAGRTDGVAGLALIACPSSGKQWLREMLALQAAMGRPDAPPEFALPHQVSEVGGIVFDAPTRAQIHAVNLTTFEGRLPHEVLLIDRDDRPPQTALAASWQRRGSYVRHAVLPGFVEMVLDPHFARPPEAIVEAFRRWLVERFGADGAHNAVSAPGSLSGRVARGVDERADFLDRERRLFGIVSAPAERTPPNRAVIILNAGANHRIGAGRVSVKVARRLAARGWLVLRFDLSGLGDSLPRRGSPENEVYTPDAVPDLATALDFLNTRYHLDRSEAVGLCSGAYHAFKAAAAGLPLTGVVVVNPLVFFWKRGMSLAYPPYQVLESSARYRRSLFQGAKWRALLRGEKDMQIMGGVVARRLGHQLLVIMREVARALHVPLKKDLARELADIDRNGIALRFLFSTGDPGEALLRDSAGSRLGWLRRRGALRVDRLNGCDHSLSSAWMHEAFYTRLLEYFDARDVRPVARRMPGNVGATARTTEPVASDV